MPLVALILLLLAHPAQAAHIHPERWYQERWCAEHGGVLEYRLDDGTRVDCLTETHAVEFDFAHKWAEAIGQSTYYAARTGKKAGIVLIMEHPRDERYMTRLRRALARCAETCPTDVWPDQ